MEILPPDQAAVTTDNPSRVFFDFNNLTLVEAAVLYGKLGFHVFPLAPNSKDPLPGWQWGRMHSRDEQTLRDWWRMHPNANIAMPQGLINGSNALDVDMKGGQDGRRSIKAITQEPFTGPLQTTPTGGAHMLFAYREGFKNFTHRGDFGGLDMRTDNGYIVVAPSRLPEGQYQWTQSGKIPAMPELLQIQCTNWSRASDTVTVDAPDVPEELIDWRTLNLKEIYFDYLAMGNTSAWDNDESRAIFAVAGALMRILQDPGQVFGIMCDNPFAWACAERHRQHGNPADWLWKYGIGKMVAKAASPAAADLFGAPGTKAIPAAETSSEAASDHPWHQLKTGDLIDTVAPELAQLVNCIIPAGKVVALVGPPGQGKTQCAIELGVAIVTGRPAFGNPEWAVPDPGACLILDCEDDRDEYHRRIRAVMNSTGYTDTELEALREHLAWFYPGGRDVRLIDREGHATPVVDELVAMINSAPVQLQHLTLGPTINLLSDDENDNAHMQALLNTWHFIATETGCSVLGIHHTTKAATMNAVRAQTSARGGGSFAGSARAVLYLQNMSKEEGEEYQLPPDEVRTWCGLSMVKANGMPEWGPVWLKRDPGSAHMHYEEDQPMLENESKAEDEEAMLAAVALTAKTLLSRDYKAGTRGPSVRVFSETFGGVVGPFGMGNTALRHVINACIDAGLLEAESEPHGNEIRRYLRVPELSTELF